MERDPARLDVAARQRALDRFGAETFDIVVIGGGITGAGCALDAATRGLSVALIEQRDLSAGTSSRSSKLFHGGLRYLEQRDFRLVAEALTERNLMLSELCPHLARPVSFLYPLHHRVTERAYVGAGIALYDAMAWRGSGARGGHNPLPAHRHLSRRAALRLVPALRADALTGAVQYWDAQVDDARHTVEVVRTAASHGALVASSLQVVGLLREGDRVVGVTARCTDTGREVTVRATQVINATATWTDQLQSLAGRGQLRVRASKGIHLVVPRDRIHAGSGLILRTATSVLFVIPWRSPTMRIDVAGRVIESAGDHGHWIVGTTDTEWNLDLAHPAASRSDIDYLLDQVNRVLRTPLTHDDIEGVYAGLRPLLQGESEDNSALSREHAVTQHVPGLISVAGGKYTTYRVMARDAVDMAARNLDRRVPPSCTDRVPLLGAVGYEALWNRRHAVAAETKLHVARIEHLLGRYGAQLPALLELIADRPDLGEPIRHGGPYLAAEVVFAATHEAALHLDDVLTRRTRLSIETFHRGVDCADEVARLMAGPLGWDERTIAEEVNHYRLRVAAERDSQTCPDDRTADAVRMGAPERRHLVRLPSRPGGD
ncbi:MAG: glycerol-3-phosphate dehydrogenase/oxidase [Acidimicrobiales bacterium]|nr:glycerol-3-phosphate dehydrogenase/oxidase [Acidimicrobiales bacterium]